MRRVLRTSRSWLWIWIPLAIAACAGGDAEPGAAETEAETDEMPAEQPAATETPAAPPAAAPTPAPAEATGGPLMDPSSPEMNMMAPEIFQVRFTTSKGDFVVEAHREWSPNGVDRFFNLVRNGFYDGTRFFRVLDGFVAQWGINGDPTIQARWRNANIPDDPVVETNTRGRLTYAKGGPNTRSTQLFINYGDNTRLDALDFPPIGEVIEGMEVVDALHSGYGEGPPGGSGPNQGQIQMQGNTYLNARFPELDYIESAVIVDGS